jgi:dynein heavy chain 2
MPLPITYPAAVDSCVILLQDDTLSQLQDMASWKTSRLMSFDSVSSHIRCHFNELLVGLMREVRQLQGLGYRMRQELSAEVDVAARFYR